MTQANATQEQEKTRALVVEDETLIRLDIVETLEDAGYEVVGEILDNQRTAIVMLTAYSQKELVDSARDAGAMAYVVKPFTAADLLPAIEIAVSRNEEIAALESEVSSLSEQFETRKRVDRAKGLLESHMGLTEPEAFRWIQKTSMDRRLTMREVADAVIEQVGRPK